MLSILETSWINRGGQEAELTVSDGEHVVLCFAHPWNESELQTDTVFELLDAVALATSNETDLIEREGTTFRHRLVGTVANKRQSIIRVGAMQFRLDSPLPGDIADNQRVAVTCDRVSW